MVCYMPLSAFPILHFMQKMKPTGPKLNNIGSRNQSQHIRKSSASRAFPRSHHGYKKSADTTDHRLLFCSPFFFFAKLRIFTGQQQGQELHVGWKDRRKLPLGGAQCGKLKSKLFSKINLVSVPREINGRSKSPPGLQNYREDRYH